MYKKIISYLFFAVFVFMANKSIATHIMGGEVKYEYLDANGPSGTPFRYRITFNVYNFCGSSSQIPNGDQQIEFGVYRADNNQLIINQTINRNCQIVTPPLPVGCVIPDFSNLCIRLCRYTTVVNLPISFSGYHVRFERCCRNGDVLNLEDAGSLGNSFYAFIPSSIYKNNSPVFSALAIPAFCVGDTITINNNATDPDGDRLIFEFVNPYDGGSPGNPAPSPPNTWTTPPFCPYANTYSLAQPFGPSGFASINPSTGLSTYYSPNSGQFVISIAVKEYRNINGVETLISTTYRDVQLLVSSQCQANDAPSGITNSTNTSSSVVFDIEEGASLSFNLQGTDINNDSVKITPSGNILDGSNGYTGTLATFPSVRGLGSTSTQFNWNTDCGKPGTYFVTAKVEDVGCPPKSRNIAYQINVNPFNAPATIIGTDVACFNANSVYTYSVSPQASSTYSWTASGGTIMTSTNNDSISIKFTTPGTYTLKFYETSQYGCIDSVSKTINVLQGAIVNAGSDANICGGTSTQLNAVNASFSSYLWTPATGLSSATVGNPTANPTTTTTYIVRGTDASTGCQSFDTVKVNVVNAVANAGTDRNFCTGIVNTQLGTTGVSGTTYIWSPAIGLNNTNIARPTVIYQNNSSADTTINYVVQATTTFLGCIKTDTVKVTIKRAPVVNAGTDGAICSGGSINVGSASQSNHTYSWTQPTGGGLSATNIANPSVSTTNTTTATVTNNYVVTSTLNGCSKADTVKVQIYPSLKNVSAGADQTLCFGTSAQLGNGGDASQTYTWTPTLALNNGSISNPTFNYLNNPTVDTTINYVVEVANAFACKTTDTIKVILKQAPIANAGIDKSICSGDTTNLGSSPESNTSYSWATTTGLFTPTASTTNASLTNATNNPVNTTYVVTATLNGCLDKDTVVVQTYPSLKNFTAGTDKVVCFGTTTTLGNNGFTGQTYTWTPTLALNNGSISNPTFNYLNNPAIDTVITYSVEVSNAFACKKTDNVVVTLKQAPIANAGIDKSICSGDTTNLGSSPESNTTYSWTTTTGLFTPTASTTNASLTNATNNPVNTTYIVTATLNGCLDKDTVVVQTYPSLKNVSAGADQTLCFGTSAQLGNGGDASQTYTWTPTLALNNGSISNPTFNYLHNPSVDTTIHYVVEVANAFACKAADTISVTLKQAPIANAGIDKSICSGDTTNLGSGPESNTSYSWATTTGLFTPTASTTNASLINSTNNPVNTTYIVTATLNGCLDTDTVVVQTYPSLKNVSAGADQTLCFGTSAQLGNGGDASQTYTWTPTLALNNGSISNPTFNYLNNPSVDTTINYIVEVANAFACKAADTISVTLKQAPIANAGIDKSICSGDTTNLGSGPESNTSYSWTTTTGLFTPTASTTNVSLTNTTTSPVNTTYIVTADLNSCLDSDTVVVQTYPSLKNVSAGADQTLCFGTSAQLGNGGDASQTYTWTPTLALNNGSISNPTFNYLNNPSVDTTINYVVEVANAFACKTADTISVTLKQAPIANAGIDVAICSGDSIQIGSATSANYVYTWNNASGLTNTAISNPIFTAINNGTNPDTVDYIVVTDINGCLDSDTIKTVVYPNTTATNLMGSPVVCPGVTGVEYGFTTYNSESTYQWFINGGTIVSINNDTATVNWGTNNPNAFIAVLENSKYGCPSDTVKLAIRVNPKLEPVIPQGLNPVCLNEAVGLLYNTSNTNGSTYTWNITGGTINSGDGTNTINATFSNVGENLVWVIESVSADTVCMGISDTLKVNVLPSPVADAGIDKFICSGESISIGTATTSTYQYNWLVTNGMSDSTLSQPTITLVNNGTEADTIDYVVKTNLNTCDDYDTVRVVVYPSLKNIDAGNDLVICSGIEQQIGTTPETGQIYTWNTLSGLSDSTVANPVFELVNISQDTTEYIYILSVDNGFGCKGLDTVKVFVKSAPLPEAGNDVAICSGASANLGTSNNTNYTYSWTQTSGLNDPTVANPVLSLENNGTTPDTLTYFVETDLLGCKEIDSVKAVVYPSLKSVNAGIDTTLCFGTTTQLGNGGDASQTYTWSPAVALSSTSVSNPLFDYSANPTSDTTITYVVNVENAFNCSVNDTVVVKLKPIPTAVAGTDVSICSGASSIIGNNGVSGVTYLWQESAGLNDTLVSNPTVSLVNNQTTPVTVTYFVTANLSGCLDKDTIDVQIYPSLKQIQAGVDTALCAGQNVVLGPSQVISNQQYTWSPAANLSATGVANPTLDSLNTSTENITLEYVMLVDNGFGCKASDTVAVTIKPQLRALTLVGNSPLCQFAANEVYSVNGFNGSTYTWVLEGTDLGTSNDSVTLNWNTAGTFNLTITETNQGCAGTAYFNLITINPKPAAPVITGDNTICPQSTNGFIYYTNGLANSTYNWTINGGAITSTSSVGDTAYINWDNTSVKDLTVIETSVHNCPSDATTKPVVFDASNVNMHVVSNKPEDETMVNLAWRLNNIENYPNQVQLYRRELVPAVSAWTLVTTLAKTDTAYTDGPLETDTKQYDYKVVGINNCGDSLITLLHNNILLKVANNEENETTDIDFSSYKNWTNDVKEYQIWRKLDDNTTFELYQTLDKSTTKVAYKNAEDGFNHCYRIVAIEQEGNRRASYSNEVCIKFNHKLFIPNVFTPNGDGTNDTWNIDNINMYPKNNIVIYNRWGTKIREYDGYNNTWTGDDLSEAVYFFVIELNNGDAPIKGWVQIMK
jgi:gliding motility-associated-like protein